MEKIKITIGRSKDIYSAYAKNVVGIYGGGDTVTEAKQSIIEAIALFKKYNTEIPEILKGEYELIYKLDTSSLFAIL